jgi:hypothetical protein
MGDLTALLLRRVRRVSGIACKQIPPHRIFQRLAENDVNEPDRARSQWTLLPAAALGEVCVQVGARDRLHRHVAEMRHDVPLNDPTVVVISSRLHTRLHRGKPDIDQEGPERLLARIDVHAVSQLGHDLDAGSLGVAPCRKAVVSPPSPPAGHGVRPEVHGERPCLGSLASIHRSAAHACSFAHSINFSEA